MCKALLRGHGCQTLHLLTTISVVSQNNSNDLCTNSDCQHDFTEDNRGVKTT